jgi:hypothetical protein
MLRRISVFLIVLITMLSLLYVAYAQMAEKGSKKTITLPNGEVVWDLNGEWDVFNENYGLWSQYGSYPNIHKITQTGSSFVGILMMNDRWYSKGWEYIRGELDRSGFKRVEIRTNLGVLDSKGQISEDGNKMVIDDGEKFRMTFTRR